MIYNTYICMYAHTFLINTYISAYHLYVIWSCHGSRNPCFAALMRKNAEDMYYSLFIQAYHKAITTTVKNAVHESSQLTV
jgi:hypothetical protein